jgi:hypothetical protein
MRLSLMSVLAALVLLGNLSAAKPDAGWRPIFNGRDLSG